MSFDTLESIIMAIFIFLLIFSTCVIICERYLPNLSVYDRTLLGIDEQYHLEFIVESPRADYNSVLSGSIFSPAEIYGTLIIPTKNNEDYIKNILSNAVNVIQELRDSYPENQWEIIVVDDLSDDETPNIVAQYACNHTEITLIKVLEQLGIGGCIQLGSFNAKGKYVFVIPPSNNMHEIRLLEKSLYDPINYHFIFSGYSFVATREAVGLFMTNLHLTNQMYMFELKLLLKHNFKENQEAWTPLSIKNKFRDNLGNIISMFQIFICYYADIWQFKQKGSLSTFQEA